MLLQRIGFHLYKSKDNKGQKTQNKKVNNWGNT